MAERKEFDVIVVGLGVMGSSSLYHCAQRGLTCLGIEQFSMPHQQGSSHGATRIIRSMYPQRHFAKMASESWELWNALERDTGKELIIETGGIDFAPSHSPNIREMVNICEDNNIAFNLLDKQEAEEKFPGFSVPEDYKVLHTHKAGIIKADKSISTLHSEAIRKGACIQDQTKVINITDLNGSIRITVEDQRLFSGRKKEPYDLYCKNVIVCPGAWLAPAVKKWFGISLECQVLQMGYYYFDTIGKDRQRSLYHASKFPVFIDYTSTDKHIYGTPSYEFPSLLKVGGHGDHFNTSHVTVDTRNYLDVPEVLEYTQERVKLFFPNADWRKPVRSESCLYTWTRDAEFLLDAVPNHPHIVVGGGGSGHAFKHGALLGKILVDKAVGSHDSPWGSLPQFCFPFHQKSFTPSKI